MIREFPPKERFDDNNGINYDDICECGHGWQHHRVTLMASLLFRPHGVQECEHCKCSKYKLDKDNISERRLTLPKKKNEQN